MKVLAFAASSSKKSINKKLATYAASLLTSAEIDILDLNDFELPLFSQDKEEELGHPELAKDFLAKIEGSDALIISFAEHNGSYSAAYKNLFDWCSRINPKVFQNKSMILLSTSPGARGGASVLAQAVNSAPFFGGTVLASYALPNFYENFDLEKSCINNEEINVLVKSAVSKLR
ncbi:NADPH-dependent FMN reductase [Neptunomonas qingdaonensis]|uniref:NAD(P)H-dependent FMN reductase n=1 Tax=Neptunomonas qingdaonensis TaxID=1045558 RepID=A0A1I2T365_9GAMM|nr:NAD(P)H-dependent oxidoreductase [Neptunomonas qingdaonensis]SFG59443.1 NAD(P)H-dependent FMN reductase [Neptunomonas qingdaonensis]